jgi:hypothetical protein
LVVAEADYFGTRARRHGFDLVMLHWARAFAFVAVIASVVTLAIYPSPLGVVAVFMTAVFVTLAVMSLITGALGKRRDGSYSAARALGWVAVMVGAVFLIVGMRD